MAKKYDIDIDGYIGSWYSSKRYVKNVLAEAGNNPVLCRVNSLGGNLDDAIDIAAQFETHGKVTCEMFSLNASSATVFTLGAKNVRMHTNSSYLIHKVLSWIDTWGYMNEDDIDATIEELKKAKDRNSALTLVVAKMYAKKSGKPIADILKLMKEEKWLSAEEAKEWGFVDEIFEDAAIKPADLEDPKTKELLNFAGLPVPPVRNKVKTENNPQNIVSEIIYGIKDIFNTTNKIISEMNKTFIFINTLLNVEGIEFKNGKVELTEEQVKTLNDAIKVANDAKKSAEDKVSEKDTKIQELQNQIDALNKKPGDDSDEVKKETDVASEEHDEMADFKSARDLFNLLP